ncbi:TonB-dependent siderophore receptor [Xanthomonas campestris pv. raphani]|uniref:TonB-dependent siderophore receptor n=1 Tax=Xanthomonas campestris TaxID=339 RepID=UPI002B22F02E|nr:TonB-dependent siderophore receptor [Xanthomonas campestris]MEA9808938.1 TonB-dependent siderophore receptor [Xanthomonas campestris pv. raphani]
MSISDRRRGHQAVSLHLSLPRAALPRPIATAIALVLCGLTVLATSPAAAAQDAQTASAARQRYSIPAGPLAPALRSLAGSANLLLSFTAAQTDGRTTAGLDGDYTAAGALTAVLAGSGLQAVLLQTGGYVLRPAPAAVTSQGEVDAWLLPTVKVTAQAERRAATSGTGSYTARAVSIGRGEQRLKDIPQSISVVTRQLMDEQNITSVYDALASTTGITIVQSPQGGKYIYARGFDITTVQYDGVPLNRGMYGRASNYSANMGIYDRAEVLRGAAGLLQGAGNPSGAVNLVRKRPLDVPGVSVMLQAGSWDRYGALLDASANLTDDGALRARGVIDYQDQRSFVDGVERRTPTYYGTLDYSVSPQTQVSLAASYEEVEGRPFFGGLPSYTDGRDIGLPRSTNLGAQWNRQSSSNRGLYLDLDHRFNADWVFKLSAVQVHERHNLKYASSSRAINPANGTGALLAARTISEADVAGVDANVIGHFNALGRRHELVLGSNYAETTVDTVYGNKNNFQTFNVFSLQRNVRAISDEEIFASAREARHGTSRELGLYSALRWQLTDPLKAIVGARVSWHDTRWNTTTTGLSPSQSIEHTRETGQVTPYAGLLYALTPTWSAYASYADIFQPQNAQNEAGDMLKPMTGANYELGLKGEWLDGRINTAFALFQVEQKNRAQADLSTSPTCRNNDFCYIDTGKVRSRGFDAEFSGEVLRDWNLFAGYTFNRTTYLQDVSSQGQTFNSYTPKHLPRVWTTYRLPGVLQDVTVGGGVSAQSAAYRQIGAATADIPGRAVWNALARYQVNRQWSLAVNLNNVFDKRYYSTLSSFVNGRYYGEPRNVMVTLRGAL